MIRTTLAATLVFVTTCMEADAELARHQAPSAQARLDESPVSRALPRPRPSSRKATPATFNPYAGWRTWCEGPAEPCLEHGDCDVDRTGRARKCVRPYWSETEKVCAIPFPGRRERMATREDLRRIVLAQCGRRCDVDRLFRFVALIAARESSYRPWKHHRLNPDIVATRSSWKRQRAVYDKNPHYPAKSRWQGWGLMGQQSATFTMMWDPKAPPEVLCRPTIAVATYLSCARRAHRKQASLGIPPTWETVHTACSLGQVVPKGPDARFRQRALRAELDPDERIERAALGAPLGPSPQARNLHVLFIEAMIGQTGGNES